MKILRICPEIYSFENLNTGLTPHIYNLSVALKKAGVEQEILTENSDSAEIEGIPIHKFSSKSPFSLLRTGLFAFKKIIKLGKDFDVIHFHNPGAALIAMKRTEIPPLIMTLHDSPMDLMSNIGGSLRERKETLYFYAMSRFAARRVSAVTCVSPGVSESVIRKFHLDSSKVHTITTAVDMNIFRQLSLRRNIDVLFVGRFVRKKQPLLLLEALLKIRESMPSIKACFVGYSQTDPLFGVLSARIKKQKKKKNITLVGCVSQQELALYYNKAKILVLPSVSESAPKVTLEAMACGTPVITTDIKGNREISLNNKTGYIVPVDSPKIVADRVGELLEDEEKRKQMGKFAAQWVKKNFTWEKIAGEYAMLYERISG